MKLNHQFKILASSLLLAWLVMGAVVLIQSESVSWFPAAPLAAQGPDPQIRFVEISRLADPNIPNPLPPCTVPENFKNEELWKELEPNNTSGTAMALPSVSSNHSLVRGNIAPFSDQDWFRFTAKAGSLLYAATSTLGSEACNTNTQLSLYDGIGTLIEQDDDAGAIAGLVASSIAGASIQVKGTYFIQNTGVGSGPIQPYQLYARVQTGAPTNESEPNNTPSTAQLLPSSGFINGTLNSASDQDWYLLGNVNAGATVYVGLDLDPERNGGAANGRTGLCCFNGFGILTDDPNTDNPPSEAFPITVKKAGDYYVYVDAPGGESQFDLSAFHDRLPQRQAEHELPHLYEHGRAQDDSGVRQSRINALNHRYTHYCGCEYIHQYPKRQQPRDARVDARKI